MIRSLFACLCMTLPAQAQVYTGFYDFTGACTQFSDSRVEVRPTELAFWESLCTLGNPRLLPDMGGAVQYTANCTGEGDSWTRELVLMQADDGGLIIMYPGFVTEYQRCP